MNPKRYFNYYLKVFKISFMNEMADRGNFLTWGLVHSLSLFTYVVFFRIIYSRVDLINGWSADQSLLVLGTGTLITGIGSLTFFDFMYDFGEEIANGDFDFRLIKPMDAHFQSAFASVDVEDIIVVPVSVLLIYHSVTNLKPDYLPLNIIGYFLTLTSSMIILFSILTLFQSLAFKFIRIDNVRNLYWSIVNSSKYPAKSIKNVSRLATVFLPPVALISSVPSEILFGRWELPWILGTFSCTIILFALSRRVFQKSLRNYSSASS